MYNNFSIALVTQLTKMANLANKNRPCNIYAVPTILFVI